MNEEIMQWWKNERVHPENGRETIFGLPDESQPYIAADDECVAIGVEGEAQLVFSHKDDLDEFIFKLIEAWHSHLKIKIANMS